MCGDKVTYVTIRWEDSRKKNYSISCEMGTVEGTWAFTTPAAALMEVYPNEIWKSTREFSKFVELLCKVIDTEIMCGESQDDVFNCRCWKQEAGFCPGYDILGVGDLIKWHLDKIEATIYGVTIGDEGGK